MLVNKRCCLFFEDLVFRINSIAYLFLDATKVLLVTLTCLMRAFSWNSFLGVAMICGIAYLQTEFEGWI